IEIDERTGIIRFIGSGRVQVDFNHRFAGKTILYDVNVIKSLNTDEEKIMGLLKRNIPVDDSKLKFEVKGSELYVTMPDEILMAEGLSTIKRIIANDIFKFVNNLEKINYIETYNKKTEKPEAKPAEAKSEEKPVQPKAA
ncbi:MAG TPA: peptidylprolyl isomerase, partial [Nitrosopumilaceae archaeon]|nr:peptidylprolyl isomerase [Nitrosopumilaceae archaeon]